MEIKYKKFIITGGSGFLGRHLIDLLINKYKVLKSNIFIPRSKEYDLTKESDVDKLFKKFKAEIVIHLATVSGGVGYYKEHPATVFHDILAMGTNLLESSRRNGVKIFMMTGSATSYPSDAKVPYKEEDLWNGYPDESEAPHGVPNRILYSLGKLYRKEYGFDTRFVILSNLYGPGYNFKTKYPHVIPSLIKKFDYALENEKDEVEIWGTGKATRDLIYVEDAAEAIVSALENYNSSEPINTGSGAEISIKEIVEKIKKLMNFKGEIVWDASKPEGRLRRVLDSEKAKKLLRFKAKTSIDEGLKNTIQSYMLSKKY